MRGKNLIWASLLTVLIIVSAFGIVAAPPATKVSVEPSSLGNVDAGTVMTVDITIDNGVGISGWEFKLDWDPLVLTAVTVTQGPFLSDVGPTLFSFRLSPLGESLRAGCALMVADTASGSGLLASVTLKAIGAGSTAVRLAESDLRDIWVMPIAHNAFDSSVNVHIGAEAESVWPESPVVNVADGINMLYAKVTNHGGLPVVAKVVFTGFTMGGEYLRYETNEETIPAHDSMTLSTDEFDATELGVGIYRLTARCFWGPVASEFNGAKAKSLKIQVRM